MMTGTGLLDAAVVTAMESSSGLPKEIPGGQIHFLE
jgi:hypothetical protein